MTEANDIERVCADNPIFTLTVRQLKTLFTAWLHDQPAPVEAEPLRYLSRKEAAERLGISLVTLDKYCKLGILTRHKVGSRYLFDQGEIDKRIKNGSHGSA